MRIEIIISIITIKNNSTVKSKTHIPEMSLLFQWYQQDAKVIPKKLANTFEIQYKSYGQLYRGIIIIITTLIKYNHLKATRVCEQSPRPVHKFMKATCFIKKLRSRSKSQVICISKYYLATNLLKLLSCQSFDGSWS